MKISKREMILAVVSISAILFGGTWYAVDQRVEEWKTMQDRITELKSEIRLAQRNIQMEPVWQKELNELQKELKNYPGEHAVDSELANDIRAISKKYEFEILRISFLKEKKIGDLYQMGINCNWEGSLDAVVRFFAELQEQGGRYDVRTLSITPSRGQEGEKLKGSMLVQCAYTRHNEPEIRTSIQNTNEN